MKKKFLFVFLLAFVSNLIWENLHAGLYAHYMSGPVTQRALLLSTFTDAIFITILGVIFLRVAYFRQRLWFSFVIGAAVSIAVEVFALKTGRWAYNDLMPLVPIVKTGLTPTIQLGLLSYLIFKIVNLNKKYGLL